MKNQKGITLIALIITILVMLILATVTINLVIGEDGILTKAEEASEKMNMAEIKERADLVKLDLLTDLELGNNNILAVIEEYKRRLINEFGEDRVTIEGNKVTIDGKYDILINDTDLNTDVRKYLKDLRVTASIERVNSEENGKVYSTTILFNTKINMTEDEYLDLKEVSLDEKLNTVLQYVSTDFEEEFETIDEYALYVMNENYGGMYGKEYETINEWQTDSDLLTEVGMEEGSSLDIEHIYYGAYSWGIDIEERMSKNELINALYEDWITMEYVDMVYAYVIENGQEVFLGASKISKTFSYTIFENGEYEFILKDDMMGTPNEVLREKIIINNIETKNNPLFVSTNSDWTRGEYGSRYTISDYRGKEEDVTVPIKIGDKYVDLLYYTFSSNKTIKRVIISEGIEGLMNTFQNCSNLEYVKLPNSLNNIHGGSFKNCTSLTEITIPKRVSGIAVDAFEGCTNLKNIYIEEGSTLKIPTEAPWGATNAKVTIISDK